MQEYLYYKNNTDPFKEPEPIKSKSVSSKTSTTHVEKEKPSLEKRVSEGIKFQYGSQMAAAIDYIRKQDLLKKANSSQDVTEAFDKMGLHDDKESVKSHEIISPSKIIKEQEDEEEELFT